MEFEPGSFLFACGGSIYVQEKPGSREARNVFTGKNTVPFNDGDRGLTDGELRKFLNAFGFKPRDWQVGDVVRGDDYKDLPVGTVVVSDSWYKELKKLGVNSWGRSENNRLRFTDDELCYPRKIGWFEKVWKAGDTISGDDYAQVPVGTQFEGPGATFTKIASNTWQNNNTGDRSTDESWCCSREISAILPLWELDLLVNPPKSDPRTKNVKEVEYTYNSEKGTVYNYPQAYKHRDFGRVVKLPNGKFLAVPIQMPREFDTEQEAIEWLI